MTAKKRFIFYDIDGVFNTGRTTVGNGFNPSSEYTEYKNHKGYTVTGPPVLDSVGVGFMVALAEKCNAKLVCSSTWRKMYTLNEIAQAIPEMHTRGGRNLRLRFQELHTKDWKTDTAKYKTSADLDQSTRGDEIQEYLSRYDADQYIILDDLVGASKGIDEDKGTFVHVKPWDGITYSDMMKMETAFGLKGHHAIFF